jgi:pyruvate dehydrogenase E1 component alpha subunit
MEIDDLKTIFSDAWFIRAFEDCVAELSDAGKTPGLVHLSHGSEVADVVLRRHLKPTLDKITGSHRSHSLALIGDVDPVVLGAEIMGLPGGTGGGLGGTQHIVSKDILFLSSNGIVGAQVPIALGAALSARQLKTNGIAVAAFGEGASNQGGVFESLNMATALHLPILFLMHNNQMAQSTKIKDVAVVNLTARARSFGMVAEQVDGADVLSLENTFGRLTQYIRETSSPAFVELSVPRLKGHYHGDQTIQGDDQTSHADPLANLQKLLLAQDILGEEIQVIIDDACARAKGVITEAQKQPDQSDETLKCYINDHPHLMGDI